MAEQIRVINGVGEMQKVARELRQSGKVVGFVPTMGALHAGHKALVERAAEENDVTIVSIYVNPTQFGPGEDFDKYPRTFEADAELCDQAGADIIFHPDSLYGDEARTYVEVGGLGEPLCGMSRPSHFRGVATVVTKLLNIVAPDRAYFGRKDAQQLLIIQTLVRDLNLNVEIVPCDTVRENDGLAMSSRNRYLSAKERKQALAIPKALEFCKNEIARGERDAMAIVGGMADILSQQPDLEIDYVAIVDAETLDDVKTIHGNVLAAVAAKVGATRLIDNQRFEDV